MKNISLTKEGLANAPKSVWAIVFVLIVAFVTVVAGFVVIKVTGVQDTYNSAVAQEETLKKTLADRQKYHRSLAAIEEAIVKIDDRLVEAKKQLPSELNMDGFIDALATATESVGIVVYKLEASKEVKKSFLVTQPFKIEGCTGYHQIGTFLAKLSGIQRIITFDEFKMSNDTFGGRGSARISGGMPDCQQSGLYPFSAVVSTYKYSG